MKDATPHPIHYEQKPVAVIYCYRATGVAQTYAILIELWYHGEQLAFIEPVHCLGLRQTQINLWLHQALSKLSCTYRLDLREMVYSFTLDPMECPLQSCPLPLSGFSEKEESLVQEEIQHGGWVNIWSYPRFYASLLATYAGISDQDAIELLHQLETGGYVQFGKQIRDVLSIKSHAFVFNPRCKTYLVDPTQVSMGTNKQNLALREAHPFTTYRQIWKLARILQTFKVRDILICAEVGSLMTLWYLSQLYQTGYLRRMQDSIVDSDNEAFTYALIRDSGPIAPLICKSGVVCDINNPPTIHRPD